MAITAYEELPERLINQFLRISSIDDILLLNDAIMMLDDDEYAECLSYNDYAYHHTIIWKVEEWATIIHPYDPDITETFLYQIDCVEILNSSLFYLIVASTREAADIGEILYPDALPVMHNDDDHQDE